MNETANPVQRAHLSLTESSGSRQNSVYQEGQMYLQKKTSPYWPVTVAGKGAGQQRATIPDISI
jgi:hypothetical protein